MKQVKEIKLLMTRKDAKEYLEFLEAKKRIEDIYIIAELEIFIEGFEKEEGRREK